MPKQAGPLIVPLSSLSLKDIAIAGGKNASLGEMIQQLSSEGISVPGGFATTSDAFRLFIAKNNLEKKLKALLAELHTDNFSNLKEISASAQMLMTGAKLPDELSTEIEKCYRELCNTTGREPEMAIRSSATAEDLPEASFAGQHDSFLNIKGFQAIQQAVHRCFVSLYNARAIKYRIDNGFPHEKVALSVGIQLMVRSDLACSGVIFTIEPKTGFRNAMVITSSWGLGENVVQGSVNPDEYHLFKPSIGKYPISVIAKKLGSKATTMVYSAHSSGIITEETPVEKQAAWTLTDEEIEKLGRWSLIIEKHYRTPMDIEWAKDGTDGKLYILQARPETIHGKTVSKQVKEFTLLKKGPVLVSGLGVGTGINYGKARVLKGPEEAHKLQEGEVLVTDITNPDWDPILKKAAAIITNKGGRTSHAAIVARECGAIAVVGTGNATSAIHDGMMVTVDTTQGKTGWVYDGQAEWETKEHNFNNLVMPSTHPMLILADPDKAYRYSFYPNEGVGLMRMEFIINHSIQVHPMALVKFDKVKKHDEREKIEQLTGGYSGKESYFTEKLSQAVATIAAAFYPKDVIVRMSDFKSNEYAHLTGGADFELAEENPMIGFRGASRYYHDNYREGFRLECEAMAIVRDKMGLTNLKLMIPFCRTVEEGKKVLSLMKKFGLERGVNGLEIYVMAEIPSNILLAEQFAEIFDGFSIGSNDLTQLTLGIDRDSELVSTLFDEKNEAVKMLISKLIETAHERGVKVGLCGQAPSDFPEYTDFLISKGINSISFNPDALLQGIEYMIRAEQNETA